jgi:hypothetical protein
VSWVHRVKCDGCHRERDTDHPELLHWYRVDRRVLGIELPDSDADTYDFCSLPCLTTWAASRELEMSR